jgi:cytochrome c peroxidase
MKMLRTLLWTSLAAASLSAPAMNSMGGVMSVNWQPLPEMPPIPADNPITEPKVLLGKTLWFDKRLSKDGSLSCNSCHNVMAGGDDNRPNSIGLGDKHTDRSSPTIWNAGYQSVQFWDGRAKSLEEQAKEPFVSPAQMAMPNWDAILERLYKMPAYVEMFKMAFPNEENPVNPDNVAKALATYERVLNTPNSSYDRYLKGEMTALTEQQLRGMKTFAEAGCPTCHSGPNFSGPQNPDGFFMKFPLFAGSDYDKKYKLLDDLGRYDVTKHEQDKYVWRVPTLRNIALTAPYLHNGSAVTLFEVIKVMGKTQSNRDLSDEQITDIAMFLDALTGDFPIQTIPRMPAAPGMTFTSSKK